MIQQTGFSRASVMPHPPVEESRSSVSFGIKVDKSLRFTYRPSLNQELQKTFTPQKLFEFKKTGPANVLITAKKTVVLEDRASAPVGIYSIIMQKIGTPDQNPKILFQTAQNIPIKKNGDIVFDIDTSAAGKYLSELTAKKALKIAQEAGFAAKPIPWWKKALNAIVPPAKLESSAPCPVTYV